jgi:type IV conjugative transfer system coupling protein TraD
MKSIEDVIQGGQIWAHKVRMFRQVVKLAILCSFCVSLVFFLVKIFSLDNDILKSSWAYWKAIFISSFSETINIDSSLWKRLTHVSYQGDYIEVAVEEVIRYTQRPYEYFRMAVAFYFDKAWILFLYSLAGFSAFFMLRGHLIGKKQHVSGSKIVPSWKLRVELFLKRKASTIKIGNVPIAKGTETTHILISGGTGSGKTVCLHNLLPQIREQGQRVVIVDTTGDFVKKYYREGKDKILSPFDERGLPWHPWIECSEVYDYDSVAESFIPSTNSEREEFWRNAARSVFSVVLQRTNSARKLSEAVKVLLYEPLTELCEFVKGSKATAYLDVSSEKTAGSIRSVASSYLECLEHVADTRDPFSIRKWVQDESDDSWLFLCTKMSQRTATRPLISSWLSIAMKSLMQMDPSQDRRLWFVIDELPSLQRLKDLESFVTESRKYGGCGVFAIQSPAQMEEIYGRENARVIMANCMTKVVFGEQDPETAEKISRIFGSQEVKELQDGISYGSHQMRDGINLSGQKKDKPVVSATDMQTLKPKTAFIRLNGNFPITKIKI